MYTQKDKRKIILIFHVFVFNSLLIKINGTFESREWEGKKKKKNDYKSLIYLDRNEKRKRKKDYKSYIYLDL